MGSPPPTDFPAPAAAGPAPSFGEPAAVAGPCGVSLSVPDWLKLLGQSLPLPPFPPFPPLPKLNLRFKLTCDPTNPVDVSGGLTWGAGRESNAPPDPDDTEDDPTF